MSVIHGGGWGCLKFDSGGRRLGDPNEDLFGFRGREDIAKGIHGKSERIGAAMLDCHEESKGEGDIDDSSRCRQIVCKPGFNGKLWERRGKHGCDGDVLRKAARSKEQAYLYILAIVECCCKFVARRDENATHM